MTELLTSIGTILTAFWTWFATATASLITNELFQIALALVVVSIVIGVVVYIFRQIKFKNPSSRSKKD